MLVEPVITPPPHQAGMGAGCDCPAARRCHPPDARARPRSVSLQGSHDDVMSSAPPARQRDPPWKCRTNHPPPRLVAWGPPAAVRGALRDTLLCWVVRGALSCLRWTSSAVVR
jgi:hypothetical protein